MTDKDILHRQAQLGTSNLAAKLFEASPSSAHYVLLGARDQAGKPLISEDTSLNKIPMLKDWNQKRATKAEVQQHLAKGGAVGVVPLSVSHVCIDIDSEPQIGGEVVQAELGPAAHVAYTHRGLHLWYKVAKPPSAFKTRKYEHPRGFKGEIRWSEGTQCRIWDNQAFIEFMDDADIIGSIPIDTADICNLLPVPPGQSNGKGYSFPPPNEDGTPSSEPKEGSRDSHMFSNAQWLVDQGAADKDDPRFLKLTKAFIDAGLTSAECKAKIASALKRRPTSKDANELFDQVEKPLQDSGPLMAPQTRQGLKQVLQHLGIKIRSNIRTGMIECAQDDSRWGVVDDKLEAEIRTQAEERCFVTPTGDGPIKPWKLSESAWRQYWLAELGKHLADPFLSDYLDHIPAKWDPILNTWLKDLFPKWHGDTDEALVKWASRFMFLAPVQRAMQPGSPVRTFPVLIGPKGCGKTSAVMHLLPSWMHSRYVVTSFDFALRAKDRIEKVRGAIIIETGEMVGLSRADERDLKAFLTTVHFQYRPAYGRNVEDVSRRDTMVGTANPGCVFPNDSALLSRMAVIETLCERASEKVEPYMDKIRDRAFGAAKWLYGQGEHLVHALPQKLENAQVVSVSRHESSYNARLEIAASEAVAQIYRNLADDGEPVPARIQYKELFDTCSKKHTFNNKQLADALSTIGGHKTRPCIGGNRTWMWEFPNIKPAPRSVLVEANTSTG